MVQTLQARTGRGSRAGVTGQAVYSRTYPCLRAQINAITYCICGEITGNDGDAWLRVVAIANHDGVVELLLAAPLLPELPRRHRPPPAVLPPHAEHLRLEADEPEQIEPPRERLEVAEHLLVAGEPAGVLGARGGSSGEGEVEEAHGLARQVGAERRVEAGVRRRGAERVGGRGGGRVEPGAPDGGGALEDDGRVPLAAELAGRRQARRARAHDGEAEGSRRHGDGARWRAVWSLGCWKLERVGLWAYLLVSVFFFFPFLASCLADVTAGSPAAGRRDYYSGHDCVNDRSASFRLGIVFFCVVRRHRRSQARTAHLDCSQRQPSNRHPRAQIGLCMGYAENRKHSGPIQRAIVKLSAREKVNKTFAADNN